MPTRNGTASPADSRSPALRCVPCALCPAPRACPPARRSTYAAGIPDPLSLQEYLVERCERCDRVGFTLHDGREFLDWVTEVTDSLVLLDWAPSPMDLDPPAEQGLLDAVADGFTAGRMTADRGEPEPVRQPGRSDHRAGPGRVNSRRRSSVLADRQGSGVSEVRSPKSGPGRCRPSALAACSAACRVFASSSASPMRLYSASLRLTARARAASRRSRLP